MKKNNDELIKLFEKDHFGDLLQKAMIMNFIVDNYVLGDINKFKSELEKLEITTITNGDEDYAKKIEMPLIKLKIIIELITTKKIASNQKDFITLGNILSEVANEISKIGIMSIGLGS